MTYPRTVKGLLDSNETTYLENLFFNKLNTLPGTYMRLWRHLNETRDPVVSSIITKIDEYIQCHFGRDFVIWSDFFSYRKHGQELFPGFHQDNMFWSVDKHDCAGFNLWILLNHHQYNKSFDIFEVDKNPRLYEGLNANDFTEKQRELFIPRIQDPAYNARRTQVPLSIGEALVLKQVEIHRTDSDKLSMDQWRLGLGFKVVRQGYMIHDFPGAAMNLDRGYQLLRAEPLLPDLDMFTWTWSPFDTTILSEYWQKQDASKNAVPA